MLYIIKKNEASLGSFNVLASSFPSNIIRGQLYFPCTEKDEAFFTGCTGESQAENVDGNSIEATTAKSIKSTSNDVPPANTSGSNDYYATADKNTTTCTTVSAAVDSIKSCSLKGESIHKETIILPLANVDLEDLD